MEITANIAGKGLARLEIQRDQIRSVRHGGSIDPSCPYVSPGFVDIQINGFAGIDFSDARISIPRSPQRASRGLENRSDGLSAPRSSRTPSNNSSRISSAGSCPAARRVVLPQPCPAYHLEGPYLSSGPGRAAPMIPSLMRSPDWEEFMTLQEAAGGQIAIVTLAPELPGACDFIRKASAAGVVVALGHTDGGPEHIHAAVEAGATLSTHLGNGCPQMIHRHQNPLWAQLASDRLSAGLICDGFHLPAGSGPGRLPRKGRRALHSDHRCRARGRACSGPIFAGGIGN